jgi:alpha-D-xyloside xylohydrolase
MKFSSGYWRPADGFEVVYGRRPYDAVAGARVLTVLVPTRPVETRRNTLNNPAMTVTYSSPLPGIITVDLVHHGGGIDRGPAFALDVSDRHDVEVEVTADRARLASGPLAVEVDLDGEWSARFLAGGRTLTSSGSKSLGLATAGDGRRYVHERLSLDVGELVYGLGERSAPLVRNGQSVDIWNDDGGPSSDQAYKNVPFYLSNQGYGVFVDSPGRVSFEIGSEFTSRVQFSLPGERLRYHVIAGPTPAEVLERYTALTGRPQVPPAWSFGLWLSTSFVTEYDEETVSAFVDEMAKRDLPLSVFHFDTFWMREFHWCDFTWDERRFPDPAGMLSRLKARGLRICLWINPYIAQQSVLFEQGCQEGYFLRRADGSVWQTDTWQSGMAVVDFTNPAARDWYASKLTGLLDMGVDAFKTDFGERIPTDVVYHDGSDPSLMHNFYSLLYNQTVFEALEHHRGRGDAVVFARAATAGGQRYPVHWGGDPEPTYVSMGESLRSGLSLGLSGFGFWSHDIGGFEGIPEPGLFMRWAAFGLLSSHSRLHGSVNYRVPWEFGELAVDVVRQFTKLKLRLMPYLLAAADEAASRGTPVMRAMVLEFPDDPACSHLDRQYMLGRDLLVAPVFDDDGEVTFYLPGGCWTHLLSGDVVEGGRWLTERHGFESLPLYVRPGAVIPFGALDTTTDYDYRRDVTILVDASRTEPSRVVRVQGPSGLPAAEFVLDRDGDRLQVTARSNLQWSLVVTGSVGVAGCHGGTTATHPLGTTVIPDGPTSVVTLVLGR